MKEKSQLTNLQTEIQTRYDSLSKRLKQVAQYILDNSDSIVLIRSPRLQKKQMSLPLH